MDSKLKEYNYGKCLLNKNNLKVFFTEKNIDIDFLTVQEKQICENLSKKKSRICSFKIICPSNPLKYSQNKAFSCAIVSTFR